MSHDAAVGVFQSMHSEWDSSQSESLPVVHHSSYGSVNPTNITTATAKPQLASVTEKAEVCCLYFTYLFCFIAGVYV